MPPSRSPGLAKVVRYATYVQFGYQQANAPVEAILEAVDSSRSGELRRDVLVISDHGMAPFHTAVSLANLLRNAGIDLTKIGLRTTGPATHVQVNLQGREPPSGTGVLSSDYPALVASIARALRETTDPNAFLNPRERRLVSHVWTRPDDCGQPGTCTDLGQDSGDVHALMVEGTTSTGSRPPGSPA
jgi:Type I phosphodiesterase / nucleotide pyrophosphatase